MADVEATSVGIGRRSLPVRAVIAVVLAVLANVVLVLGAQALELAPGFEPLTLQPVALFSAAGVVGATAVYWLLGRVAANRDRNAMFVRVAAVVLVLSFLPDVALLVNDPAATAPGVLALMITHVVVAVVAVGLLVSGEGTR